MVPNVLLLRQVLHQIETQPETWKQAYYRGATGMCFAGWTAQISGGKWITNDLDDHYCDYLMADDDDPVYVKVDGMPAVDAGVRARRLLGLDSYQADDLFESSNSLDDIREQVTALIAQVRHVTIRIVPEGELVLGEALPGGIAPLEVMEHRPGDQPMFHGGERGIAPKRLRNHARVVADRLGVPYVDPIDPAALERLSWAEAA